MKDVIIPEWKDSMGTPHSQIGSFLSAFGVAIKLALPVFHGHTLSEKVFHTKQGFFCFKQTCICDLYCVFKMA